MACWLYEGMLLFGVLFSAGLAFSIVAQMRNAMDPRHALFQVFLFVICGVYCVWFWSRGQTLAMRTWRIALVDAHGRRVTQGRAFLRYVYSWMWVVPPLAAVQSRAFTGTQLAVLCGAWVAVWAVASRFHPQRQFWHDAWAGTRLVDAPVPEAEPALRG